MSDNNVCPECGHKSIILDTFKQSDYVNPVQKKVCTRCGYVAMAKVIEVCAPKVVEVHAPLVPPHQLFEEMQRAQLVINAQANTINALVNTHWDQLTIKMLMEIRDKRREMGKLGEELIEMLQNVPEWEGGEK